MEPKRIDADQLITKLRALGMNLGIFPAAVKCSAAEGGYEKRTDYHEGWNACAMRVMREFDKAVDDATDSYWGDPERLFSASGDYYTFFHQDGKWHVFLNDTWYYASGDAEEIPTEKFGEVAELFRKFGTAGALYWVYRQRGHLPDIPWAKRRVESVLALLAADEAERIERAERRARLREQNAEKKD